MIALPQNRPGELQVSRLGVGGAAVSRTESRPVRVTIHMADTDLLPSAVAQLALRLHRTGEAALAGYLGRAVDKLRDEIPLRENNYLTVLAVLKEECPPNLEALRDHLEFAVTQPRLLPAS